jgi:hypothetical protein
MAHRVAIVFAPVLAATDIVKPMNLSLFVPPIVPQMCTAVMISATRQKIATTVSKIVASAQLSMPVAGINRTEPTNVLVAMSKIALTEHGCWRNIV